MNIGNRIKELRLSKRMTQADLAGHEITRNMLSRIENGAALPSVGTVIYLANRLGVPASLLLAEDDDELLFYKNSLLIRIKKALNDNNHEICLEMCNEILAQGNDDEIAFIYIRATYLLAESCLLNGQLRKCCALLDTVIKSADLTCYDTSIYRFCATDLFYHLKQISPSLYCEQYNEGNAPLVYRISCISELCRYLNILKELKENTHFDKDALTSLCTMDNELYTLHLKAEIEMSSGNYEEALSMLYSIVNYDEVPPKFMILLVCEDIERCADQTGDFKVAYEYSKSKLSLLESMLAEE